MSYLEYLLTRHELSMNPFGLSLSKPFDKLKANGV